MARPSGSRVQKVKILIKNIAYIINYIHYNRGILRRKLNNQIAVVDLLHRMLYIVHVLVTVNIVPAGDIYQGTAQ